MSQDPSLEAVVIAQEGQQVFLDALTRLNPTHRDVLVLRGYRHRHVAALAGPGRIAAQCERSVPATIGQVEGGFEGPAAPKTQCRCQSGRCSCTWHLRR